MTLAAAVGPIFSKSPLYGHQTLLMLWIIPGMMYNPSRGHLKEIEQAAV
jgi:hypothetical protein